MARRYNAGRSGPSTKDRAGKGRSRFREQNKCRFCREKVKHIDYKDVEVLQKLVTQHGKMFSRKRSGNCASHQRSAQRAIKRARFMGLIPYVT